MVPRFLLCATLALASRTPGELREAALTAPALTAGELTAAPELTAPEPVLTYVPTAPEPVLTRVPEPVLSEPVLTAAERASLPRLALATVAIYPPAPPSSESCPQALLGMIGWCQGAQRMANALDGIARAEPLILTNQTAIVRAICPGVRLVEPDQTVSRLAQRWAQTHGHAFDPPSGGSDAFTLANLQKLQLLNEAEYDALLFTDGDVMLQSAQDSAAVVQKVRQLWRTRLPRFLGDAGAEILGSPDVMAPINGGLWLAKPSRAAYETATAMLQRNVWNVTHGFDLIGEPRSLWPSINASCNEPQRVNSTIFLGANNWHCVGCGTDQGALFYIFHVLRNGTYRQTDGTRSDMQVAHWWSHPKPWEVRDSHGLGQRLEYFNSLVLGDDLVNASSATANSSEAGLASRCVRQLCELKGAAEEARRAAERDVVGPNRQNVILVGETPETRSALAVAHNHKPAGLRWLSMSM